MNEKKYGVYGVMWRMWQGNVNFNQKPKYATDDIEEAKAFVEKKLEGLWNGDGILIVDYEKRSVIFCKYKEDGEIHEFINKI